MMNLEADDLEAVFWHESIVLSCHCSSG